MTDNDIRCWPWVNYCRLAVLLILACAFVAASFSGSTDWWIGPVVALVAALASVFVPVSFTLRANGDLVARYPVHRVTIPAGAVVQISKRGVTLFDANPVGPRFRIASEGSRVDVPTSSVHSRLLIEPAVRSNPLARVDYRVWEHFEGADLA